MRNLIGNRWADASNNKTVNVFDPALSKLIDSVPSSTIDDVELCVDAAKKVMREWSTTSLTERSNILTRFKEIVNSEIEPLAQLLSSETGRTIRDTRLEIKSIDRTVTNINGKAYTLCGSINQNETNISGISVLSLTTYKPAGVVASLLPYNTPIESFCDGVLAALIMGNAVIVKPSTEAPLTITKLAYLLRKAGVPSGVIEVIHGQGGIVGQALCANKDVGLIYLKGNVQMNKEVMSTSSRNLTRIISVRNSNSTFILDRTGNINDAVDEVIKSRINNCGQETYSPKRFFIHNKIKEEFTNKLIEKIKALNIGDPKKNITDMGCLTSESAACNIENKVKLIASKGSDIIYGGKRKGAFYEPTIINVSKETIINELNDDVFGPIVSICGFEDIDDVINIINEKINDDVVCAFTNDLKIAHNLSNSLSNSYISLNSIPKYLEDDNNYLSRFAKVSTTILKNKF